MEFASAAAPNTLLFESGRHRACGILSRISFNTLRATAAPATEGRPTKARTNGKATTDLEFGQTWDEVGTKLGCNE